MKNGSHEVLLSFRIGERKSTPHAKVNSEIVAASHDIIIIDEVDEEKDNDEEWNREYTIKMHRNDEKRHTQSENIKEEDQQSRKPRFNVISKDKVIVIVKKGDNQDDLETGNYVVVGAFRKILNCEKYIANLSNKQIQCQYGYNSQTELYYAYVHFNENDLNLALSEAIKYRKTKQFYDTWVLTVE